LADLVVYGIGVLPNAELAADAGLRVANGICVDAQLLTATRPAFRGPNRMPSATWCWRWTTRATRSTARCA